MDSYFYLGKSESQLTIQVHVVVPWEPVPGIQLSIGQAHHLRKTGVDPGHPVDDALRGNEGLVADDPHGSAVHAWVALAYARSCGQRKGIAWHLCATDVDANSGSPIPKIPQT